MVPGSFFAQQQWLDFRNDDATTAPAFGVMTVTGVVVVSADELTVLTVVRPTTYGCQANCVINGPVDVPTGAYGRCTRSGTVVALYDSGGTTPAYGLSFGPRNASWKLKSQTGGFMALGAPTNATQFLAMFVPLPMNWFLGVNETGATITKGTTGTITVMAGGSLGSETETAVTVTGVLARWGDIKDEAVVRCFWVTDADGVGNWEAEICDTCP